MTATAFNRLTRNHQRRHCYTACDKTTARVPVILWLVQAR